MPPRATRNTRSKGAAAAAADGGAAAAAASTAATYALEAESTNPPRLFVLPRAASADARVVTLPHPRYAAKPARYLVCPQTGVYEFTQIASPQAAPRSWLVEGGRGTAAAAEAAAEPPAAGPAAFVTHTMRDADLFVATAVDPLFLVLPALAADTRAGDDDDGGSGRRRLFLSADDHFDALPTLSRKDGGEDDEDGNEDSNDGGNDDGYSLAQLLRDQPAVRARFEARMAAVCDTVEAGDETMYRLNEAKLLLALLGKAQRTSEHLPASVEAQFVAKALQAPVGSTQGTQAKKGGGGGGAPAAAVSQAAGSATPLSTAESLDSSGAESQASAATTESASTAASTAATTASAASDDDDAVRVAMQASEEVVALQRLRVAFRFVCSRYVRPALVAALEAALAGGAGGVDFGPLDAYVAQLAAVRQATARARAAALDYASGSKRGFSALGGGADDDDDDAAAYERAEKRRKQQEEEKRKKAGESRGVRDLKKVNVSGMKKLSEFFKKK